MPAQTALMTGAELAATRAFLGFSQAQLAEYLQATAPKREDEDEPELTDDAEERRAIRRELRSAATLLFEHGQPKVAHMVNDIADSIAEGNIARKSSNNLRRLQRMEQGKAAIPAGIIDEIDEMYEVATNLVNNLVIQYKAKVKKAEESGEDVVLTTQRDGDTSGRYPACWHRAVCARVAAAVPGLVIDYDDEG
jgi:hypothetical protein